MRVELIDCIHPVIASQKREFFGKVYDDSGNLIKTEALISEIFPIKGGWYWKAHVLHNGIFNDNHGTRLTYQEAWAAMQAYVNQD